MTNTIETSSIATRLRDVHQLMEQAQQRAGRTCDNINLIAVSKFHPLQAVEEAYMAGQRIFGENRVQEAAHKFPPLMRDLSDIQLHLIGGLQRNKAGEAVKLAHTIESLDRPSLADALLKEGDKIGHLPHLFIEVNTADEPQKFGIPREQADRFIRESQKRFGPLLEGLMCIPPQHEDPRPHFRLLRKMAHEHGLEKLSMGMSHDFPIAIEEGATHIRVGTAIFGPRPHQQQSTTS